MKSEFDLKKAHENQSRINELLNDKNPQFNWTISEIIETVESFSFRVFRDKNTDTFWQYIKR